MNHPISRDGYQSRTVMGLRRLASWTGAWVAATFLMGFGPKYLWDRAFAVTLLAVGLNIGMGIALILAQRKYIAGQDDLQRKVHLEAMGITLGVAVFIGVPYELLDQQGIIPFHFSYLLILMSLTYVLSNLYGQWRYR